MLRSIGAVVAGFVAMAVVVMLGTMVATIALVPGGMATMRSGAKGPMPQSYLAANLGVSFLAAVLGGWLTATIAARNTGAHVVALVAFMLVMSAVSARTNASGAQPSWYPTTIAIVGAVGAAVGWLIRAYA